MSRLPTVTVSPLYIARGLAAGLAGGAAAGLLWGFLSRGGGFAGLFLLIIALGVGWTISEAISLATNRKRSPILQGCAVLGAAAAYFAHNAVLAGPILPSNDGWGYFAAAVAAFFAASRLRV